MKQVTLVEVKERHDKGLRCKCDEQFHPGHRYKSQHVLLVEGYWADEVEHELTLQEPNDLIQVGAPEITLQAIAWAKTSKLMRVKRYINKMPIVILVDTEGATTSLSRKVKLSGLNPRTKLDLR